MIGSTTFFLWFPANNPFSWFLWYLFMLYALPPSCNRFRCTLDTPHSPTCNIPASYRQFGSSDDVIVPFTLEGFFFHAILAQTTQRQILHSLSSSTVLRITLNKLIRNRCDERIRREECAVCHPIAADRSHVGMEEQVWRHLPKFTSLVVKGSGSQLNPDQTRKNAKQITSFQHP